MSVRLVAPGGSVRLLSVGRTYAEAGCSEAWEITEQSGGVLVLHCGSERRELEARDFRALVASGEWVECRVREVTCRSCGGRPGPGCIS